MTLQTPPVTHELTVQDFAQTYDRLKQALCAVIVGQEDVVDGVLTALFARGHVLIEGVPGLGKTLLCGRSRGLCSVPSSASSLRQT